MKKLLSTILLFFILPLSAFAFNPPPTLQCEHYSEQDQLPTGQFSNFYLDPTSGQYSYAYELWLTGGGDVIQQADHSFDPWASVIITIYFDKDSGAWLNDSYVESNHYYWAMGCDNTTLQNRKGGTLFGNSGESLDIVSGGGGSALASVGFVSANAFNSIFPYLLLSAGVFISFYVIQQITFLFDPKKEVLKIKKDKK